MDNANPLVLIVEDDPSLSKMYALKFKKEGINVSIAHDGATGLAKAAEESPKLILLDMMLPKYTGIEFLEQIQQHGKATDIPVIALTNLTEKKDVDRAKELGVKEYLAKAMHTPEEIVTTAKKYLGPIGEPGSNSHPQPEEQTHTDS